ncbi:MAG: methyltransferase domain-containing protein [Bacteroidetes bacterium]|nr:methyltransferase domain-containing protein [Bacteroidota bacterium]
MDTAHYSSKQENYFMHVRMDVISLLPLLPQQKVLEIGAGTCNTLVYLKEHKLAAEVMGVELMKIPGSNQEHPSIDRFQLADIERDSIEANEAYFDTIICADILEHLADPWLAVKKITRYLKPGGTMIVSIPNIREIKTMMQLLLKADFRYDAAGGIMDKTHLRFFCKKNIRELLTTDELTPVYATPNFMLKVVTDGRKRRIINRVTLGLIKDLLTVQYIFVAKKKS